MIQRRVFANALAIAAAAPDPQQVRQLLRHQQRLGLLWVSEFNKHDHLLRRRPQLEGNLPLLPLSSGPRPRFIKVQGHGAFGLRREMREHLLRHQHCIRQRHRSLAWLATDDDHRSTTARRSLAKQMWHRGAILREQPTDDRSFMRGRERRMQIRPSAEGPLIREIIPIAVLRQRTDHAQLRHTLQISRRSHATIHGGK